MEYLELSVPIVGSGKFIELHHTGALQRAQSLWSRYLRLRKSLEGVNEELRKCNDANWLYQFLGTCQRQKRDFEKQLRRLVKSLENNRRALEEQEVSLCTKLRGVDPSLSEAAHTLVGARLLHDYENSALALRRSGDDVLRRGGIIAKNLGLSSLELCRRFDLACISVRDEWTGQFPGVHSWVSAYENKHCRKLIQKMISKAKRKLRHLP
jgi:hypothetical protein